jgi:hypothetical protein
MITFLDGTDRDELLQKWVAQNSGFQRIGRGDRWVVCYVARDEATVPFNDYAQKQQVLPDGRLLRLNQVRPYEGADPMTFVCAERLEEAPPIWSAAVPMVQARDDRPWTADDAVARLWGAFAGAGMPARLRPWLRDALVEAFQAGFDLASDFGADEEEGEEKRVLF